MATERTNAYVHAQDDPDWIVAGQLAQAQARIAVLTAQRDHARRWATWWRYLCVNHRSLGHPQDTPGLASDGWYPGAAEQTEDR